MPVNARDNSGKMVFFEKVVGWIRKKPLWSILLFSLLLRIIYLSFKFPLWWDSHIYIGMGKYIFSSGELGIWESFRPVIHPFVIGLFWKMGLDPILIGKMLDLVFSVLIIYLTYLIAEKAFNQKAAIFSSLILSVTPIFLKLNGLVLSEPLALFLGLMGVYLYINSKRTISRLAAGLLLGLAFLTKFTFGIFLLAVILNILITKNKLWPKVKEITALSFGFFILLGPYLLLNYYYLYGDVFGTFKYSTQIATASVWNYGSGISYYFFHFFLYNPLLLFFFGYFFIFFKQKLFKEDNQRLIFSISLLTLIYFFYLP